MERTPAKKAGRPARTAESRAVRVYAECGVTVNMGDYQSIRFAFGHERIARNDSAAEIEKAEALAYEACERIVEKRVRKLQRLVKAVQKSEG